MKKLSFIIILTFIFGFIFLSAAFAQDGAINLTVTGFKNDNGTVKVALFSSAEGFPFESEHAFKTFTGQIKDGASSITISGIPYGTYAISLFHDDNNNGKLPLSFWGKPLKGIGISNNPPKKNRAPRFDEAKFALDKFFLDMQITVIYY